MNVTFYSNVSTSEMALSNAPTLKKHTIRSYKISEAEKLLSEAKDTEVLIVDAMGSVDKNLIDSLPKLRLIHSEGVGYQGFDIEYARKKNIPVCNNKGINDTAVAEGTILLILGCLRSIITGNQAVYDGRQIQVKRESFGNIRELSECTVGLVGFGDIARKTAEFLNALGATVLYTNRTRYADLEEKYNVRYADLDTLLACSDFVSLHTAVTSETMNMVDSVFLSKMKKTAFLINTARGDLVDNQALLTAIRNGDIAGAGLDVIAPEPVEAGNILLAEDIREKLVLTPHIAGITSLTIKRLFNKIEENINRLEKGEKLENRVN